MVTLFPESLRSTDSSQNLLNQCTEVTDSIVLISNQTWDIAIHFMANYPHMFLNCLWSRILKILTFWNSSTHPTSTHPTATYPIETRQKGKDSSHQLKLNVLSIPTHKWQDSNPKLLWFITAQLLRIYFFSCKYILVKQSFHKKHMQT